MTQEPSSEPVAANSLLKSSAVVGSMTMLSRILGLVRDVAFAAFVGATANADAFFVAFKIPNCSIVTSVEFPTQVPKSEHAA